MAKTPISPSSRQRAKTLTRRRHYMQRNTCAGNSCSCLIQAGSNVTVEGKGTASDTYIVSASGGGGGGGSAEWGDITGTLSDQADLQSALNAKTPLATPALTGNPTAPTPST